MTDQDPMVAHRVTHAVEAAEHVAERAEHAAEHVAEHAVTAEDAAELTDAVNKLIREVHSRSVGFLIALILITALGIAVVVLGYRSEHFLSCQVQQNAEFRDAAKTERAAQRRLFDVVMNPANTQADRFKATQDYYAGLIAADQQRTDVGAC